MGEGSWERRSGKAEQLFLRHFDFKHLRPILSRHEKMAGGFLIGDAIEHLGAVGLAKMPPEASEVQPSGDAAVLRRNAGDFIGLVNVGENLAVDPFQLVEVGHWALAV